LVILLESNKTYQQPKLTVDVTQDKDQEKDGFTVSKKHMTDKLVLIMSSLITHMTYQ
jgi:hypothetical protein